ncbi:MAG: hypothetical protein JNK52_04945 [Zoogloeaceae bacterium]|nr:hypothetical protein [Zoogloeaceae bacterium]
MREQYQPVPIVGEDLLFTELTVNSKGGAMTAILKKAIRESLGEVGSRLGAASLTFDTGASVVLLTGASDANAASTQVRVSRLGKNRFMLDLETGESEEVDEMTDAFVRLKIEQFKLGRLDLLPAITADEWQVEMDERFRRAEAGPSCAPGE